MVFFSRFSASYPNVPPTISWKSIHKVSICYKTCWLLMVFYCHIVEIFTQWNTQTIHIKSDKLIYVSVSSVSWVTQLCPTLWDRMDCSTPGLPVHHQLPEFTQTHVHWVGDAIQLDERMPSHPLSSPLLPPSVFPSIRVFSNESVLHIRWPKDWSFSFSISPSSEHSGLIFFRMNWLDLLAVQGTLKSLLQHHKSIISLVLSFLYGPNLTSIHDYWKNRSLD